MNKNESEFSQEEILRCISFLNHLVDNSGRIATLSEKQRIDIMTAAGKLSRPDRDAIRARNREVSLTTRGIILNNERRIRASTGIRVAREAAIFTAPKQISNSYEELSAGNKNLLNPRNCYVCKEKFTTVHFFYDSMCPGCADFNYKKRFQTAPLHGKVALITGARLKIGYQATLMMLRTGAKVIATTRFPVDAAIRFSAEKDFSQWGARLQIYGLDLRHTPSVDFFAGFIERNNDRLDILINNAAQTVRRPPGFYTHLMGNETQPLQKLPVDTQSLLNGYSDCKKQISSFSGHDVTLESALPVTWKGNIPGIGICASAQLSQIPYAYDNTLADEKIFPSGKLDADMQQVDLRKTNSWRLRLGEIETSELLEIQLVNAIAPFVLCNKLAGLMKRDNTGQKHIVNVSAMEGKFQRFHKEDRHPHTNMAKAALNMLTHTSSGDFAKAGIFMNAVDTGWVTDEDPAALAKFKETVHDFQPPLDIIDGAARICDPFFNGILTGTHWCGKFLKDYHPIDW